VTCLLDVNLLMALLWENHEHHHAARVWLRNVPTFATCPVSQLGYGLAPEMAFGVLRQFLADPRHRFIPDDLSCSDRVVRTDLMRGANQITDRYLVALARQHGCSLATLDKPLAKAFIAEPSLVQLVQ
jgi:toxin-antitoxin system PIN domain toxin